MSINDLLAGYLQANAPEEWQEFLKAQDGFDSLNQSRGQKTDGTILAFEYLRNSTGRLLSGNLQGEEQKIFFKNAEQCLRRYELKKKLVTEYATGKFWKEKSNTMVDKNCFAWFCIFLLTCYHFFEDIRFLNTFCKIADRIGVKSDLRINTVLKIMEPHVVG